MKLSKFKEKCLDTIVKNYNNRKVICYGDVDKEFENLLYDAGISISFSILRNRTLCDNEHIFDADTVYGKKDNYYVLSFTSSNNEKESQWIREFGYTSEKDYLFMGNTPATVPLGKIDYYDNEGNICNYCPDNCRIVFSGHNSEVYIPMNIKIKKHLEIRVGNDCKVSIGSKVKVKDGTWLLNGDCINVTVSDDSSLGENDLIMYSNSSLEIGEKTSFISSMIRAFHNTKIVIGKDCMISQKVILFAGDGHALFDVNTSKRINYPYENEERINQILVNDHVWLGMNATLLNGTEIGMGSVVGMNAVLKGSYNNNCCIVGNPAKIVRKDIAWSRNIMDLDISSCGLEYINTTDDLEEKTSENC